MFRVARYCDEKKIVNFTFDEMSSESLQAAVLLRFSEAKRLFRADNDPIIDRIGGLEVEDSKKARPLQAADLLAYEAHRYAKAAKGNKRHPPRTEYHRALRRFIHRDDFWLFDGVRFDHIKRLSEAIHRRSLGSDF